MKRITIVIFTFVLLCARAQSPVTRCTSEDYFNLFLSTNAAYRDTVNALPQKTEAFRSTGEAENDFDIYIPVVFHVVYNPDYGNQVNISDAQITDQLFILNAGFANAYSHALGVNTKIKFCLAKRDPNNQPTNGITRDIHTKTEFLIDASTNDESTLRSISHWPKDKYLNVWVTNLKRSENGQIVDHLGQSNFPFGFSGNDGIMLNYKYCGATGAANVTNFDKGKTLIHEVGHWLGIFHTFHESNPSACTRCIPNCATCGDLIDDTDPQNKPAMEDNYWASGIDQTKKNTCDLSCQSSLPLISAENYMDYNYDQFLNFFTQGQKDRMRANLLQYRFSFYHYSETNPSFFPIECNPLEDPIYTTVPKDPEEECITEKYPDELFRVNGREEPYIELCEGTPAVFNRYNPANKSCLKLLCLKRRRTCTDQAFYEGNCPLNNDKCNKICELFQSCWCWEMVKSLFISVTYGCDENFNGGSELTDWRSYGCGVSGNEAIPINFNFGTELGLSFQPGFYRVKIAVWDENGNFREGIKHVRVIPDNLSYQSLPNWGQNNILPTLNTYKASNNITFSQSNVLTRDLNFNAGNELTMSDELNVPGGYECRFSSTPIGCYQSVSKTNLELVPPTKFIKKASEHGFSKETLMYYDDYVAANRRKDGKSDMFKSSAEQLVYPNPCSNTIFVDPGQLKIEQISLIGPLGQIYKLNLNAKGEIDMSKFPNGIYIIKLDTREGTTSSKLIVSH